MPARQLARHGRILRDQHTAGAFDNARVAAPSISMGATSRQLCRGGASRAASHFLPLHQTRGFFMMRSSKRSA